MSAFGQQKNKTIVIFSYVFIIFQKVYTQCINIYL